MWVFLQRLEYYTRQLSVYFAVVNHSLLHDEVIVILSVLGSSFSRFSN